MGQPVILAILCLGSAMIGSSMALYTSLYSGYDEEPNSGDILNTNDSDPFSTMDVMCNLALWLWYMGMVTIMTVLTCKLYRVHRVMRFRRKQTILLQHVFGPFVVAQLVGIGILTTAQIFFPQRYRTFHKDEGSIRFCCPKSNAFGSKTLGIVYVVLFGYLEVLTIGILLFAWKVRHVNEEIGHSRRLFWLCAFDAIALAAGLVAMGLVLIPHHDFDIVDKNIVIYGTLSVLFAHNAIGSIVVLIFPMIYYVWYESKHGRLPDNVELLGVGRVKVNVKLKNETTEANSASVPDGSS
eukprot:CAMPEP_0197189754 /NCGR_PEP_ID=MMETSP1423-20130617/20340_1 /TAXON_ID=476441 /ORGANISM="Pseudo-nitzschia heimii, Strain UNC1101" /LENGTH=295 /DNA_ID=CAMNT_0042641957 /DNA_START=268 /DNA_END=1158 /DNA_ORIENTATION=-